MADWYVFQHDGEYLGPWTTEVVANAILSGKLGPDVWVAAPGGPRWLRALDVPVIARLIDSLPTRPKRRDSGLRLMPGAYSVQQGKPAFGSTVMMVEGAEIDEAAQTTKMPAMRFFEDERVTDPVLAAEPTPTPTPSSPKPKPASRGNATLESPSSKRRKARSG